MTCFRANVRGLALLLALMMAAGCTPPPGVGDQTQAEHYFDAGKSRTQRQDFTGAIAAYEQALQADPQMAQAHFEMATLFDKELNSPVKALYHYVRALELNPNLQGADFISNRLSEVKMRVAGDSLPRIGSPILEKEIDQLQGEVKTLTRENAQLKEANNTLNQQLALLQRRPVEIAQQAVPTPAPQTEQVTSSQRTPEVIESRTPPQATPAAPVDRPRTYVVQHGDTLYGLSRRFGISVDQLKAANPGTSAQNFQAGRTINVPAN
jgi:LysM repeat protein